MPSIREKRKTLSRKKAGNTATCSVISLAANNAQTQRESVKLGLLQSLLSNTMGLRMRTPMRQLRKCRQQETPFQQDGGTAKGQINQAMQKNHSKPPGQPKGEYPASCRSGIGNKNHDCQPHAKRPHKAKLCEELKRVAM